MIADLAVAHSQGDFGVIGPRGCGKSKIVEELGARLGFTTETVVLYHDMNSRDLFQRRRMRDNGDTLWEDSQLVAAAKKGDVCVLDGAEKVHWSALESLQTLCHHRLLFLPDGSRLVGEEEFGNIQKRTGFDEIVLNSKGIFRIPKSFRLVLIGDSSSTDRLWLKESIMSLMPFIEMQKLTAEEQCTIIARSVPSADYKVVRALVDFVDGLRLSTDAGLRGVASSLSLRKLIHIVKRDSLHPGELRRLVENAALAKFLPSVLRMSFYSELEKAAFAADSAASTGKYSLLEAPISCHTHTSHTDAYIQ
ncbi:ATPase family protein [Oesophagostomum dentatum]|uniref:ATPase family protein n=1 Tax=Oesophagostomum dentatum TaxID=61180 RepID=A0A0B1TNK2_OESDE|nr:ATPase family protein [Oesophagostomum dentatum]